jgi:NADH:ubiquinone oxidoreductase subunit 5 (subunit L)/multisubunit Na+/H+ antiporter MnhA subunit
VALLGFSAALLHVLNHAIFKGLLFMAGGAVGQSTGTMAMDRLGGLAKLMPITSALFALGSAAIVGLPPLNGFVSEFLLLSSALQGATAPSELVVVPIVAFGGMAVVSGLAAATFAKAYGITFLGAPRSSDVLQARETAWLARVSLAALGALVVAIGIAGPFALRSVLPAAAQVAGAPLTEVTALLAPTTAALWNVTTVAAFFIALVGSLALLRRRLLARREVRAAVTWDCGYERPSPRMQYTSYSFAQPLVDVFRTVVRPRRSVSPLPSYFPGRAAFAEDTGDVFTTSVYSPTLGWIEWASARVRMLQRGRVHLYLLYILLTLVVLLVWGLGLQGVTG